MQILRSFLITFFLKPSKYIYDVYIFKPKINYFYKMTRILILLKIWISDDFGEFVWKKVLMILDTALFLSSYCLHSNVICFPDSTDELLMRVDKLVPYRHYKKRDERIFLISNRNVENIADINSEKKVTKIHTSMSLVMRKK